MADGGRYIIFNEMSGEISGRSREAVVGSLDGTGGFAALADKFYLEDIKVITAQGNALRWRGIGHRRRR